jgi:ribosomal-protein-alanine N-acetyltransferase
MDYAGLAYTIEPMQLEDIPDVLEIEHVAFPTPWPARAYRHEVSENRLAHYFVARPHFVEEFEEEIRKENPGLLQRVQRWAIGTRSDGPSVVGYCGFWMAADEGHLSTIAVDPSYREQGIGQLLLITAIERALELGANIMSLEVRVSNTTAQSLYRKYGFKVVGRRRRYYSDNREDALIMTVEHIASAPYQRMFQKRREQLIQRLRWIPTAASEKWPHESVPSSELSTNDADRSRPEEDLHQECDGSQKIGERTFRAMEDESKDGVG